MSETIDNIVGNHITNLEVPGLTYNSGFEVYSIGAPQPPKPISCSPISTGPIGGPQLRDLNINKPIPQPSQAPEGKENLRVYDLGKGVQIHLHEGAGCGNLKIGNNSILDLNSYDSAMTDHTLQTVGLIPKDVLCNLRDLNLKK